MMLEVKKFLILKSASIQESLNGIDNCGSKCLVVVDKQNKMIGTLSDGDLRKAILKGKKLSSKISNIYNKKPKYLLVNNYSNFNAQKIFLNHLVDLIPIINKENEIIRIIRIDDVFKNRNNKIKKNVSTPVIIMAGGKGSRLEPFTSILPKPLIPINGKPIIDHIIDRFNINGVSEYYVSVNYKSQILKSFFKEIKHKNKIKFIEEKKPLGTVGALSKIDKKIKPNFFVTNCDVIIDCDYSDVIDYHKKNKNILTIIASFRNFTIPYGDCKINKNGLLEKINEKPTVNLLANTGMYLMNKKAIKHIPKNTKFDINQLVDKLTSHNERIGIFPISEESWIDIGQWSEYKKAIRNINFEE